MTKYLTMHELKNCTDPGILRAQATKRLEINRELVGTLYPAINYAEAGQLNGMAFDLENPHLVRRRIPHDSP